MTPCKIDGCDRPAKARVLCENHYRSAWLAGELDKHPKIERVYPRAERLTDIDLEARRGTCVDHGPGVPLRIRKRINVPDYVACDRCEKRSSRRNPDRERVRNRLRKYGLTDAEFTIMSEAQAGKCLICQQVPDRVLAVDHDHATGAVRGLLCHGCNVGIGWMRDDPVLLERAAKYLRRATG